MSLWGKLMGRGRRSQAWLARAEALAELGRHEEALAGYDRALALDPRRAMALRGKAIVLRKMDKTAEALEAVELALQVDPRLALAWRAKGAILRDLRRDADALACYEQGLTIDPRDVLLWNNKGNVCLALGRVAEAQASYQRALSINPELASALEGMRSCHITKSLRREYHVGGHWSSVAPEPSMPPRTERLVVAVSNINLLERWLSVVGFRLEERIVGRKCVLMGGNFVEYGGHREASLLLDACRLGNWGKSGAHDVWFTFEPDSWAERGGPQYDGWNRLAEVLASNVKQDPLQQEMR